jgi:hypothetical protein
MGLVIKRFLFLKIVIDHACEALCSTIPHEEKYDTLATDALNLLLPCLLQEKQSPSLEAYSKCQMRTWNAIKPIIAPTPV